MTSLDTRAESESGSSFSGGTEPPRKQRRTLHVQPQANLPMERLRSDKSSCWPECAIRKREKLDPRPIEIPGWRYPRDLHASGEPSCSLHCACRSAGNRTIHPLKPDL